MNHSHINKTIKHNDWSDIQIISIEIILGIHVINTCDCHF